MIRWMGRLAGMGLAMIVVTTLLWSCGSGDAARSAEDATTVPEAIPASEPEPMPVEEPDAVPIQTAAGFDDLGFELFVPTQPVDLSAHERYLDEEPIFSSVETLSLPEARYYALVASDRAVIHHSGRLVVQSTDSSYMPPTATIESEARAIPIGTVLPIYEIYNTGMEMNLVQFDGEYNYFYRTEYEGRPGLVFGADLYPGSGPTMDANVYTVLRRSPEVLQRYAYYYAKPRTGDAWTDFNGLRSFSPEALERLARDRMVYERVLPTEYSLDGTHPADMLALYDELNDDRSQTIYLTADLFAHAIHLVFHTALKTAEEFELYPRLESFLADLINAIEATEVSEEYAEYYAAAQLARDYLLVGAALLDLAPVRNANTFPVVYEEVDREVVLSRYPDLVRREVELILDARGFVPSPLIGIREDYSQYRPRGHYTENGVLSAYFRAMMWFGRIHFPISTSAERVLDQSESAAEATARLLPTALVIQERLRADRALGERWSALFDPITVLIGQADDLGFYELESIADAVDWDDLPAWLESEENIERYVERAVRELRPPAIAGNSVFYSLSEAPEGEGEPPNVPPGFRLFGQRFTHDSYVHQLTSSPRLMGRMFVAGIDIFDAMGSATARSFLGEDLTAQSYDQELLIETLDRLRGLFAGDAPDFYYRSYYTAQLRLLRALARFETGSGLYFTETPAWGVRALTAAHGSWAELRHDTLLYVKQVYAEMGGDEYGPTFRAMPFDRPIHYIEPNRDFFIAAINLLRILGAQEMLRGEMIDLGPQLERFEQMCRTALTIVEKELADRPITPEENEFIVSAAEQLVPIVIGTYPSEYSTVPPEEFRRALVADVFTNAEVGRVLEIATGIPYRLHVALNDGDGGKRIATGYGYSYYEFYGPMDERMTNEEWREIVYESGDPLDRYLPFWMEETVLPAGTTSMLIDE